MPNLNVILEKEATFVGFFLFLCYNLFIMELVYVKSSSAVKLGYLLVLISLFLIGFGGYLSYKDNTKLDPIEDIISSNSYYDMSKKHSRKNKNVDIISYFTEIAKFNNEDKESNRFGKRFKMKDSEIKNPNPIQNVNVPVNTDNIDKQIYEDKNNFDDEFK